jgi:hypothetical protein
MTTDKTCGRRQRGRPTNGKCEPAHAYAQTGAIELEDSEPPAVRGHDVWRRLARFPTTTEEFSWRPSARRPVSQYWPPTSRPAKRCNYICKYRDQGCLRAAPHLDSPRRASALTGEPTDTVWACGLHHAEAASTGGAVCGPRHRLLRERSKGCSGDATLGGSDRAPRRSPVGPRTDHTCLPELKARDVVCKALRLCNARPKLRYPGSVVRPSGLRRRNAERLANEPTK